MMNNRLHAFISSVLMPRHKDEDKRRTEYILNVLLLGIIALVTSLFIIVLINYIIYSGAHEGINPFTLFGLIVPFAIIFILSKIGKLGLSTHLFIAYSVLLASYPLFIWRILLPQSLLMYSLLIIMAGILLGTRKAFVLTGLMAGLLVTIVALGNAGVLNFETSWLKESGGYNDAVSYSVSLVCIALVAWLLNQELSRSLVATQRAERNLIRERNSLEIEVRKRTAELEKAQRDKMLELHRFAEFGRVSSTLLHELASPITAVLLNLEMVEPSKDNKFLKRARLGLDHIEAYVLSARKQLRKEGEISRFNVLGEVRKVIELLEPQARSQNVNVRLNHEGRHYLTGDPVRFRQIIANLIVNALDAYRDSKDGEVVNISIESLNKSVTICVQDFGVGISHEALGQIFEPFYTTKDSSRGTGIGLAITKQAVVEDFRGSIQATSSVKLGTKFTVRFPTK